MNIADNYKKRETVDEAEQQFILRLPQHVAESIDADLISSAQMKQKLNIVINSDMRHMDVIYDGLAYRGRLVDLPNIIEVQKTTDKTNFCKSGNICQMLICEDGDQKYDANEPAPSSPDEKSNSKGVMKKILHDKRYIHQHGITPPMKNVRKKRFRKCLLNNGLDYSSIEADVRQLIKADLASSNVKLEVVWFDKDGNEIKPGKLRIYTHFVHDAYIILYYSIALCLNCRNL